MLSISPIFPSGSRILSFVQGTNGMVCGLRNNGSMGHGYLVAFFSRFPHIAPLFSPFSCALWRLIVSIVIL